MSNELRSQEEVENLLSAIDSGPAPQAGLKASSPRGSSRHRDKVSTYDFKRPERVGKDMMRSLQTLHEGFGRNFAAKLSALLRRMVEVKLTSVDQLTYSEFVFSLENPSCFNLLRAAPLEGNLVLDINPSILYPIIDRFEWENPQHWHNSGLWDFDIQPDGTFVRVLNKPYAEELRRCQAKISENADHLMNS